MTTIFVTTNSPSHSYLPTYCTVDKSNQRLQYQELKETFKDIQNWKDPVIELNLANVGLRSKGAVALAKFLARYHKIRTLNLSGNKALLVSETETETLDGIQALLEVLKHKPSNNTSLEKLNLSNTALPSMAALYLAEMLEENYLLVSLNLANNPNMGKEGIARLILALRTNKTLKQLNLCETLVETSNLKELALALGVKLPASDAPSGSGILGSIGATALYFMKAVAGVGVNHSLKEIFLSPSLYNVRDNQIIIDAICQQRKDLKIDLMSAAVSYASHSVSADDSPGSHSVSTAVSHASHSVSADVSPGSGSGKSSASSQHNSPATPSILWTNSPSPPPYKDERVSAAASQQPSQKLKL